jgi:hypothetical protein
MTIMRDYLKSMGDESGLALIAALLMLASLTAIGTFAFSVTSVNEEIAGHLRASKQAFYLAEAGLEWGRQQVRASAVIPPLPPGATQTLGPGSYTVTFALMPPGLDFSYTLAIQSVGTVGNASKTLRTLVTKTYDLTDAAITIRGNEADSSFTGTSFTVDGRDYDHVTGALTGAMQYGITVPSQALQPGVDNALASNQKDNVIGTGGTATTASIGVSSWLPSSSVTTLADALCAAAPLAHQFTTPVNGTYSLSGDNTWGTRASPQINCVTGVGTPGNMSMDIYDNFSGVGVLIVRTADLVIHGAFHFEGLIIVTGAKVGFGLMGGGNKDVYGSILVNETDHDGASYKEDVLQGAANVRYSRSALNVARQLMPAAALTSIITTLPVSVQQLAWQEVNL